MALVLESMAKIVFMLLVIVGLVPPLIWAERKGAAFIQDRTGPNRCQILGVRLGGLIHPIGDVLKLLFKEDVIPDRVHRVLYCLAPMMVMGVALTTYAVIPFGDFIEIGGKRIPLVVADLNVGVLYILAVASLATYGVVLAGWASNNKFTFLGGVRATSQMISYEISLGLAIMGLLMIFSTFSPMELVRGQGELLFGFLPKWGIVVQPLGFLLFITAAFAEANRNPFDLPEGESEIVAGFHLEYSSMKFALFFMGEYCAMVAMAALTATLFFGGWQIPWLPRPVLVGHAGVIIPLMMMLKVLVFGWIATLFFRRAQREKNKFGDSRDREPALLGGVFAVLAVLVLFGFALKPWTAGPTVASLFATFAQIGAFIVKVVFFSWLYIWVRWTLPRFRYDQLMRLGWKVMIPLGLANLVGTALVMALLPRG